MELATMVALVFLLAEALVAAGVMEATAVQVVLEMDFQVEQQVQVALLQQHPLVVVEVALVI
jgi:hypothetical protein